MTTTLKGKAAARCLFGRPDLGKVSRELDAGISRINDEDARKWNFDFVGGIPLDNSEADYQFESVSAGDVPDFYRDKTIRARKTVRRRASTPMSETVEIPRAERLFVVGSPEKKEPPMFIAASTSRQINVYEKPVTRSAKRAEDSLKQTKLTNFMPVRKRRSETCLVSASLSRSVSIDSNLGSAKEKSTGKMGKGAPKRPLKFVSSNLSKPHSSVSDTTLVSSPRSPPTKKVSIATRRTTRRPTGAGDF